MLLRPGHWDNFWHRDYMCTGDISKGHLVGCVLSGARKPQNPVDSTLKLENSRSNGEARLGGRTLAFRFSKINALKNTANQVTLRNITGTHIITVPKIIPVSGP